MAFPLALMAFAIMPRNERQFAQRSLALTLIPGAPAQQAALAAVAVTTQAHDAVRHAQRAVSATLDVVAERATSTTAVPLPDVVARYPVLRGLDVVPRFEVFEQAVATPVTQAGGTAPALGSAAQQAQAAATDPGTITVEEVLAIAGQMVVAALQKTSRRTFTEDEAEAYGDFLELLDEQVRDKIVKNA